MIVRRNLTWNQVLHYTWKGLLYYIILSTVVFLLHSAFQVAYLSIPFNIITALSTALAIFLGFKNNNAYDRWWEARKIWGLLVNYSRAWGREAITMMIPANTEERAEVRALQERLIFRHVAFVNSLRVFLRQKHSYNETGQEELYEQDNHYDDTKEFLIPHEFQALCKKNNPPNYLIQLQGEDLQRAHEKGWLSDYRFVRMDETLIEFNNIQGRCERIKNTPFPRHYSFFSRIFVFIHNTLLPFAFIKELGWINIPICVLISFVFLALDLIGERTEDPFENRLEDTPMTSLSKTIETNLREQWGNKDFPEKPQPIEGVVF